MSVQNYETDVLQEHVDSTPILVRRLDQWRHGVQVIQSYVNGYLQVHQGTASHLDKTLKQISEAPNFEGIQSSETGSQPQLATVFDDLQSNVNVLLQRSNATINAIQSNIQPPLDQVSSEIEKHYKSLKTHGGKGIKEVERSRSDTQRLIEHLGQVTSSYGSRNLSSSDDPYIIHRRVEGALLEQIGRENTQAEAALSVQKSFASLETNVIQTLRSSLASLAALTDGFDKAEHDINATITNLFKNINLDAEWKSFTKANKSNLVPNVGYQRDPARVTFVNKNHSSTRPLVEGYLNRKGTVFKSYSESLYAISSAGYLYQFKQSEPSQDSSPDLSLYLPDCQISRSTKPGEFLFKVVGKDSQKTLSTRHKYTFKTSSARDLEIWYTAISRVTGNVGVNEDDSSAEESHAEAPVAQLAGANIDERATTTQSPRSQVGSPVTSPTLQNTSSTFNAVPQQAPVSQQAVSQQAPVIQQTPVSQQAPVSQRSEVPHNVGSSTYADATSPTVETSQSYPNAAHYQGTNEPPTVTTVSPTVPQYASQRLSNTPLGNSNPLSSTEPVHDNISHLDNQPPQIPEINHLSRSTADRNVAGNAQTSYSNAANNKPSDPFAGF